MHRRAERAQNADPPVANLVAEPFDDHRAIVGHDTGGLGLLGEIHDHIASRELVE